MDRNWFRNITWNEEIEEHFFKKLSRVRDKDMQAQYLNLQAGSLVYTKDTKLMEIAESLINKQLTEYSDIIFYKSRAFGLLGDIYGFRGNYNKAIDYYKQAIDFEANFSNSITNSYLSYSELIVKTQRTDLYNDLEKTLLEERYSLSTNFPVAKYIGYSVLSIINKHKGDIEKAKYYAVLAEQNATALESGFNNHKTLGLVRERDKLLDKLMYE